MKKLSLLWGIALTLLLSFSTVHAEDFWQDTLWIRKMPLGGKNITKVMFHPDGKSVFAGSDQYLFQYDVQTGNILKTIETKSKYHVGDYLLSNDNQFIIIGTMAIDNKLIEGFYVEVWHIDTGFVKSLRIKFPAHTRRLALSPDGNKLYIGTVTIGLHIVDLPTMKLEKTNDKIGDEIALSPDGKTLISTIEYPIDISVLVSPDDLQPISSLNESIHSPKFSSNGKYIGGTTWGVEPDWVNYVTLYNVETEELTLMQGHKGQVHDVCFTHDDAFIVSVASGESGAPAKGGYRVWKIEEKKQIFEAPYYTGTTGFCTLSPDNSIYAIDGTFAVVLWRFRGLTDIIEDENNTGKNKLKAIPNPTHNVITIQLPIRINSKCVCTIYNSYGSLVKQTEMHSDNTKKNHISLDVAELPNGSYTCLIKLDYQNYTTSFIINR